MAGIAGAVGHVDAGVRTAVRQALAALGHRTQSAREGWSREEAASGSSVLLAANSPDPGTCPRSVVFDGALYNRAALLERLAARGTALLAPSDGEIAAHAFAAWGAGFVEQLEGAFALAAWDPQTGSLLLARDRLGYRPLYWTVRPGPSGRSTLYFASEVRALLAGGAERRIDPVGLATFLWNGFVASPVTMVRGIASVMPGTRLDIDAAGRRTEQSYWTLPRYAKAGPARDRLHGALRGAVERQLERGGDGGFFLSGGMDSSAVVALAREVSDGPLHTFNVAFDAAGFDESPYALAVAQALGTEHERIVVTESFFQSQLESALRALDQPTFDGLNTYLVSAAVRSRGVRVALGGTGGDDLFGGNRTFSDVPRAMLWGRRMQPVPTHLLQLAGRAVERAKRRGQLPLQTRWGKLGDVLAARGDLLACYQLAYALFTPEFARELGPGAGSAPLGLPAERHASLRAFEHENPDLYAIALLELAVFVGDRLLRDIDATSSAVGLEIRAPLLDEGVLAAWCATDLNYTLLPVGVKQVLRDAALAKLPPELFDRPKAGFVLPLEQWCVSSLAGQLESTLRDATHCRAVGLDPGVVERLWTAFQRREPGLYWSRVWAVFVYLWWTREQRLVLWLKEMEPVVPPPRIVIVSPCRDEERTLARTIAAMRAQTRPPDRWIVVDDGSTDRTPEILAAAAKEIPWLRVVRCTDRGFRKVGGGVIDAFYAGLESVDIPYDFVSKMDVDLEFSPRYIERVLEYFAGDPELAGLSGKVYREDGSGLVEEFMIDEMVAGQFKFYRREAFERIGGFVREVMWDGIDFHRARMEGLRTASVDDPELRILHLRLMGASDKSVYRGRLRWGRGQWFMGSCFPYVLASGVFRMQEKPYAIGGLLIIIGYLLSGLRGEPRYPDLAFRRALWRWQYGRLYGLLRGAGAR